MINRIAGISSAAKAEFGTATDRPGGGDFNLQELLRPVEQVIVKNPGLALAAAFAIGVTLACWIKRR